MSAIPWGYWLSPHPHHVNCRAVPLNSVFVPIHGLNDLLKTQIFKKITPSPKYLKAHHCFDKDFWWGQWSSKWTAPALSPPPSGSTFSLTPEPTPAPPTLFLFIQAIVHLPTTGTLHMLLPLRWMIFLPSCLVNSCLFFKAQFSH